MNCEICGKDIDTSYNVYVEGVMMQLCRDCSKFGKVVEKPKVPVKRQNKIKIEKEEFIEVLVDNFSNKIRNARELRKLKQKDLAIKTGIKESLIHKIESGHIEPSLDIAKKLEDFLNIKLIEKRKEEHHKAKVGKDNLTIGDILNVK